MSFQKPIQYPKVPTINHSALREPTRVTIAAPPKWVKNNTKCIIELILNGVKHNYWTEKKSIADAIAPYVGKDVVLTAWGDDRRKTDAMNVTEVVDGVAPEMAAKLPKREPQPVREVAPEPRKEQPALDPVDRKAKVFLCQAANLMRLCVKKANDIAIELDLPDAHRQGIATTLFIQADRQGYISGMPISAYSIEELGWGASKGESLKTPQPEDHRIKQY